MKVNSTDLFFATIIQNGRTLARISMSGMTSLADIFRYISRTIDNARGLVTLQLRNYTQGWNQRRSLLLAA